jgi:hypothetical protein
MGKHTAESGIAATALLLLFFLLGPDMKPNLMTSALFVIGVLFIGGSLDSYFKQVSAQTATPSHGTIASTAPGVTITGGDNVVSVGQIGGITARVVNINPPMNPELRILGKSEKDNTDGSHTAYIQTEVSSPITPGLLSVQIDAEGILNVSIAPPPTNGFSAIEMRNVSRGPSRFSAEIPSPRGKYDIVVTTRFAVPINLSASF